MYGYREILWSCASPSLGLFFALACDDLDLLGFNVVLVVQLEFHILDDKGPDFVAEAVGVEVTLESL